MRWQTVWERERYSPPAWTGDGTRKRGISQRTDSHLQHPMPSSNTCAIASGGAGNKEHFYDALTKGRTNAALAASLFPL